MCVYMLVDVFVGRNTCIHIYICIEYLKCFILSKLYAQLIQSGEIPLEFIK